MKVFELIEVSFMTKVSAVKNGMITDAYEAFLKIRDLFNGMEFSLKTGLESKENVKETLSQQVESFLLMEDMVAHFNKQLRELGVYKNDAQRLPLYYQVEVAVAKRLGIWRTKLDSIVCYSLENSDMECADRYCVYTLKGKCGVVSKDGVATPPVFDKIDATEGSNATDELLIGKKDGEYYYVMPGDRLVSFEEDDPDDAIRIKLIEYDDQEWVNSKIY